jgi:phage terminase small subunit
MSITAKLTLRQQRFIDAYALSGNASDSARQAGYGERSAKVTASRLLTKANVSTALAVRQAEYAAELQITKEDVVGGILSAINMAREQGNPGAMIQGCAALAKLCGFYKPCSVGGDDLLPAKAKFLAMPEDELLAMALGRC